MDDNNLLNSSAIPLGLGMALAQNERAMAIFTNLAEPERQSIIDRTHEVRSKEEMQSLVDSLV